MSTLTPETLHLPKGKPGVLTVTITPTQGDPTGVPLASSAPGTVEVPPSVTVPSGAAQAEIPVLPRHEGEATITAGPLNQSSQQARITVTPAELLTLSLTPPAPATPLGKPEPFTAIGAYTDGATHDRTAAVTWTSSSETIATITPGGIATGLKEGQVTITAREGDITGTATLTITSPVLASLAVSPANPSRLVGQGVPFTATGTLTDGTTQDLTTTVTWSSSNAAVVGIIGTGPSAGLATALAQGQTTITATHPAGFTASTLLTVSAPLPPTITGFAPLGGPLGTLVTLTGTNLDTTTQVTFNGSLAAFSVLSPTQLTATVPVGASTGPISVSTLGGTVSAGGELQPAPAPHPHGDGPAGRGNPHG